MAPLQLHCPRISSRSPLHSTQSPCSSPNNMSGATSHMTSHPGTLSHITPTGPSSGSSIVVGNGSLLPVTTSGAVHLPGSLHLSNLIKNLISVRQFTIDNNCSVEFDPFGCSVKDLLSKREIIRCNSTGALYPFRPPASSSSSFIASVATTAASLWHRRLGHPEQALGTLARTSSIPRAAVVAPHLCHACQLGRHCRLPFSISSSRATRPFDLIHCDLWTSPVPSVSGFNYYLVVLDDCTHYLWTFPLKLKSDTFSTLSNSLSFAQTQFHASIKSIQCDNGREFDNSSSRTFFASRCVHLHMSCPYTSA
ncbi:hypothetical protein U9M48_019323 [Paspalum notatum var. saurae]|uniref:Integrase catalytic domain-containing protein n=1 Tax=Paspalum notatum var. saurae TaxID=547442 RepID=A0AAQ3TCE9_PASNO